MLIAGESWTVHSIHQKGFDSFTTTEYAEGVQWLKAALEGGGWSVDFMPSHVAARDFPPTRRSARRLRLRDAERHRRQHAAAAPRYLHAVKVLPNRLHAIRDYVAGGGGLVMIGGYMTFQGIEAKAQYAGTASRGRAAGRRSCATTTASRHPQGATPHVADPEPSDRRRASPAHWPALLGYNRVVAKPGAEV